MPKYIFNANNLLKMPNYVKFLFGIVVFQKLCPGKRNYAKISKFGIENANLATLHRTHRR